MIFGWYALFSLPLQTNLNEQEDIVKSVSKRYVTQGLQGIIADTSLCVYKGAPPFSII